MAVLKHIYKLFAIPVFRKNLVLPLAHGLYQWLASKEWSKVGVTVCGLGVGHQIKALMLLWTNHSGGG